MSHNQLSRGEILATGIMSVQSRAIARLQARTQMELAEVARQAALQVTRVEAVACVGRRAMFETALLTQTEASLAALVPLAASRLQALADVATLGIAEVVADTVRLVTR